MHNFCIVFRFLSLAVTTFKCSLTIQCEVARTMLHQIRPITIHHAVPHCLLQLLDLLVIEFLHKLLYLGQRLACNKPRLQIRLRQCVGEEEQNNRERLQPRGDVFFLQQSQLTDSAKIAVVTCCSSGCCWVSGIWSLGRFATETPRRAFGRRGRKRYDVVHL